MPIARRGKFLETPDLGITHSLGIESAQLEACIGEINQRGIQGVFGAPCFGFHERNLDFLTRCRTLRQVWFWDIDLKDISGLYAHPALEYFGVSPRRPAIDFSGFSKLRTVVWQPVKGDAGIEQLPQLERLDIWRYKMANLRFDALRLPPSLRRLDLNWCNQDSLDALPTLPRLGELEIHYCRKLRSLDGLAAVAPNLRRLIVTCCPHLESIEAAKAMNLAHLHIDVRGKITHRVSTTRP